MKCTSLVGVCALALAPVCALASIVATGSATADVARGSAFWSYELRLAGAQNASPGLPFESGSVVHEGSGQGSFFTLYDFAGYVPGSCRGPAGWLCTAQASGYTPDSQNPNDDAGVLNLTWVYVSGPLLRGLPEGLELGSFGAESSFADTALLDYAARTVKSRGGTTWTVADNTGRVAGPSAGVVPEPGTLGLVAAGLLGAVAFRRRSAGTRAPATA